MRLRAVKGMSYTEALAQDRNKLRAQVRKLEQQCDELLKALKPFAYTPKNYPLHPDEVINYLVYGRDILNARAAIAAAEGRAS